MRARIRRRTAAALCVVVLSAAFAAGCTQARSGTPVPGEPGSTALNDLANTDKAQLRKQFNEDDQVVNDYWNSERLRDAEPRQPRGRAGPAPDDEPINAQIVAPRQDGAEVDLAGANEHPVPASGDGRLWPRTGLSESTVGRLYSSVNNEPFACSATVVASKSQLLVATAAHCVWDTKGSTRWADNVMFVPGDDDGKAPHGRWTVDQMYVPRQFQRTAREGDLGVTGDGWKYDVAFLRMRTQNGQRIQEAVGAQGIGFGARPDTMVVLGYPALPPYDGSTVRYCAAPRWKAGKRGEYSLGCAMTAGFSGGPWLTRFDNSQGAGYLVSVSSTTDGNVAGGTELGRVARDLYADANAGRATQ